MCHDQGCSRAELNGKKVAILAFGTVLESALKAAEECNATVANMRFIKPLDTALVLELAATHDLLVTVEDNAIMGGAGSAVLECLMAKVTVHCTCRSCTMPMTERSWDC